MMEQYAVAGSVPQLVQDVVANKIQLLDEYVLFQTGEYQYSALIHDLVTDDVTQITFTRSGNYNAYTVEETEGVWAWKLTNEYYCYSNLGYGAALDLPVMEGVQAHASVVFTVVLMFLIVFKSALFPFQKRRK